MDSLFETGCRERQARLVAELRALGASVAVLTSSEAVRWLTGAYTGPLFHPSAAIDREGHVTLVLPDRKLDTPAIADKVVPYAAKWHSTFRSEQREVSVGELQKSLGPLSGKVAAEFSWFSEHLAKNSNVEWIDIEPTLFRLRRRKHADELALLKHINLANEAVYQKARELVAPGVDELELYCELHSTVVKTLGEPFAYLGNDFRSAARGGAPRKRLAERGELWIFDITVGYQGYFSDNARTIAVGGEPTNEQEDAWRRVVGVFPFIEHRVAPGVSCKQVFEEVQAMLDGALPLVFNHHLGHGIGLSPHEGPHLNPHWDDTFEVGDVIAVEPGLYHETLRTGMRIEQNYVVTEEGVELLTPWPLGLV